MAEAIGEGVGHDACADPREPGVDQAAVRPREEHLDAVERELRDGGRRLADPGRSAPVGVDPERVRGVELEQVGPDRVAVRGVRGEAPPQQLKVCVNTLGGWRNTVELVLTPEAAAVREAVIKSEYAALTPEPLAVNSLTVDPLVASASVPARRPARASTTGDDSRPTVETFTKSTT